MNIIYAPGPWTVKGASIQAIDHGTRFTIARVANRKLSAEGVAGTAQLMAAAPELLEALRGLVNICTHPAATKESMRTIAAEARAAIAKATTL